MKLSTYIQMFLVIAIFVIIFGLMSQEIKTNYPEANVNDSAWYGKYDYSSGINNSVKPLKTALENIGDDQTGWFVKILSGIAAIPAAVIALVGTIFISVVNGGELITGGMTTLLIPSVIIAIVIIAITVWAIFKLIEVYQRWQI